MGLFSWLFSSGDKGDREASAREGAAAKGKGTRKDGTKYYQHVGERPPPPWGPRSG